MSLELIFLGTGTSAGVPMIGCDCAVCRSDDPRDHRTRPSVVVRYPDADGTPRQFLVDTSPELRLQIIRHDIRTIDAVIMTHAHADHIFGMDDLRRFNAVMEAPIDIYAEPATLDRLRHIFGYIFDRDPARSETFIAHLVPRPIDADTPFELYGTTWTPIRLMHGRLPILGFRIDHGGRAVAYCTDVSGFPPPSYRQLQGLDVLVIDALRYRHHPTHLTVDQALNEIEAIAPRRAYLTHIAHDIQHADLAERLPEGVFLSYDGLVVGGDG